MPHMPDPEDAIGFLFRCTKRNAQGNPGLLFKPVAQARASHAAHPHSGNRVRPGRRIGDVERDPGSLAPGLECGPDRTGQHSVPVPHGFQPLFVQDHVERFAQPVEMMRRRGSAEVLVIKRRIGTRSPVPVGRNAVGRLPCRIGLVVEVNEGHARRHHKALLAAGHHDIDAPVIHVEFIDGEAGDIVGKEQRRMPGIIENPAQSGDVVLDGRRGIDLHRQHGLDAMVGIGPERLGHPIEINLGAEAEIDHLGLDPEAAGHLAPALAEAPGAQDQDPVTARQRVGQRRFPGPVAIGDVDRHVVPGAGHFLEVLDNGRRHVHQRPGIDIWRRPVHRLQDTIGHDRRAGNGKVMATVGKAHGGSFLQGMCKR